MRRADGTPLDGVSPTRPRLGLTSYSFYPRVGGSARIASQLARCLPDLGWDVRLVAPLVGKEPTIPDWPSSVPIDWATVPGVRGYGSLGQRAALGAAMARAVRAARRDVDIWLSVDFQMGALAALSAKPDVPVAAIYGADPLFELEHFPGGRTSRSWTRASSLVLGTGLELCFSNLDHVIVHTPSSMLAVQRYARCPSSVIPGATRLTTEGAQWPTPGARSRRPFVLTVSRLVPWKDVEFGLRVVQQVKAKVPDLRYVVVGDGPLASALKSKYRRESWIEFALRVPPERMFEYYNKAWVLLHPSQYETFGLVLVEAMGAGVPVIGCRIAPLTEFVEHGSTGYLLPPGDVACWSDTVGELLDDRRAARAMGALAREEVIENYSLARVMGSFDSTLRAVLERSRDLPEVEAIP